VFVIFFVLIFTREIFMWPTQEMLVRMLICHGPKANSIIFYWLMMGDVVIMKRYLLFVATRTGIIDFCKGILSNVLQSWIRLSVYIVNSFMQSTIIDLGKMCQKRMVV
jgi:hypothetical protein